MKLIGVSLMFVAALCMWVTTAPTRAAVTTYTVKELRFADSPDQGAAFERNPSHRDSFICNVTGLSRNDRITGGIVAADGKNHLFVYEDGNIKDMNTIAGMSWQGSVITGDGTVIAVVGNQQQTHVLLYRDGKAQDITPPDSMVVSISQPMADGRFLLKEEDGAYLCSLKSPMERTKVPLGMLSDNGIIVGTDIQANNKTAFAYKDGQTHLFSEIATTTRKQHLNIFEPNAKGQFVATLVDGMNEKAWLVDGSANTATLIPAPSGVVTRGYATVFLDDAGDVAGMLMARTFELTPCIYRAGKSSVLSSRVTGADSVDIQTPEGVLIGRLKNGHLFRYDGKTTRDLGGLGFHIMAVRCNASGQIVGQTKMPDGEDHGFVASDGKVIDLNQFMPKDSNEYLHLARYINDDGMIIAQGWPKDAPRVPGQSILERTYVLIPNR